jgi:hypothetical protein
MKTILTLFTLGLLSVNAFTQATMEKIKNLKTDPRTVENAAKADVWIIDKKNITGDNSLNIKAVPRPKKRKTKKN